MSAETLSSFSCSAPSASALSFKPGVPPTSTKLVMGGSNRALGNAAWNLANFSYAMNKSIRVLSSMRRAAPSTPASPGASPARPGPVSVAYGMNGATAKM